jgi:hypothetical protein
MTQSRDAILLELAHEQARLVELERASESARERIESLRSALSETETRTQPSRSLPPPSDFKAPRTSAEKVSLFRSLFRGRPDLVPIRFVSKKTGKPGYAPACDNKWEPALCLLRTGGRCGDCVNQAFAPVSDQVVIDHLQGRHVMGVYPLLENETCWFLAVDFDKNSWKEDVGAFAETCRSVGAPAAIERSRSGNGAHAWFFTSWPMPTWMQTTRWQKHRSWFQKASSASRPHWRITDLLTRFRLEYGWPSDPRTGNRASRIRQCDLHTTLLSC